MGITRAGHLVDVGSSDESLGGEDGDAVAATAHEAGVALQVVEPGAHSGGMRAEHRSPNRVIADGRQDAHALGRSEGQVEGDVAACPAGRAGEHRAARRIAAVEEHPEVTFLGTT